MTDLLTPEEVKRELADAEAAVRLQLGHTSLLGVFKWVARICRDYLTLWDRNKELETTIGWYEEKHPND